MTRLLTILCLALPGWLAAQGQFEFSMNWTQNPGKRLVKMVDGLPVEYSEIDADVVEKVLPFIQEYQIKRGQMVEEEALAIETSLVDAALKEKTLKLVARLLSREQTSPAADKAYDESIADLSRLADCWRVWAGSARTVRFWNRWEVEDKKVLTSYDFGEMVYDQKTGGVSMEPPFWNGRIGRTAFTIEPDRIQPLAIDYAMMYMPGADADTLSAEAWKFLDGMPEQLRQEILIKMMASAQLWQIDRVLAAEVAPMFAPGDEVLADGVARFLLAVAYYRIKGPAEFDRTINQFFEFTLFRSTIDEAYVKGVKALDPLGDAVPADPKVRRAAVNLIAYALVKLTENEPGLFQNLTKAGIQTPAGGFDRATFLAAVRKGFGEERALEKVLATRQQEIVTVLEAGLAKQMAISQPAAPSAPPEPHPLQKERREKKFGGVTFHYPPTLEAAVDRTGPELAKRIADARKEIAELFAAQPRLEITFGEADAAALKTYGLEANAKAMEGFVYTSNLAANPGRILEEIFHIQHVNVWFSGDLKTALKAGAVIPGFRYIPETDRSSYDYLAKPVIGTRQIETVPAIELPVVLKGTFDPKLPPEEWVERIRQSGGEFLKNSQETNLAPIKERAEKARLLSERESMFILTHEAAEHALVSQVIASPERRWFCDGLANWVAIQELDRRYGDGVGMAVYQAMYDPKTMEPLREKVHLLTWEAGENEKTDLGELKPAYYYFATQALLKAMEGRPPSFMAEWLGKVKETRWNRTNIHTVARAYEELTGKNLIEMVGRGKNPSVPITAP